MEVKKTKVQKIRKKPDKSSAKTFSTIEEDIDENEDICLGCCEGYE